MHCHTVLPAKAFSRYLQYFAIECRMVEFVRIVMSRNYLPRKILKFLPQKMGKKVRNFQHYFEIEFK